MATLDRKNAYSAFPQLEKRIAELGKYIDVKDGKIQELNDRVTALEKELILLRGKPEAEEGEK